MSTIVTRAGKGSALTHNEVDANFVNLNTDKIEAAQSVTLTNKTISGSNNTLSNIGNSSLTNSSVTLGSTSISLGSTVTSVSGLTLSSPTVNTPTLSGGTINNASVGATTPSTGAFTTLSASSTVSGTGFSTYLASPPAIGGTTPAAGSFTTLSATGVTTVQAGTAAAPAITTSGDTNTGIFYPAADTVAIGTGGTERLRVDSAGNAGLGVTPSAWFSTYKALQVNTNGALTANTDFFAVSNNVFVNASANDIYLANGFAGRYRHVASSGAHQWFNAPSGTAGTQATFTQAMTLTSDGELQIAGGSTNTTYSSLGQIAIKRSNNAPYMSWHANDGTRIGYLQIQSGGVAALNVEVNQALFFATNATERARITSGGDFLVGKTATAIGTAGSSLNADGIIHNTVSQQPCLLVNRLVNDGELVRFYQDTTQEGNISVSGTTVSYNGGHLSRYAQTQAAKDESILKGTVLSNLDEMNVYTDEEGNTINNEQLNKVKVSDVEGDVNVAGVFVNWSYDEQHQVDEINMAMTGDMIIRIAQGVTVQKGDLLMSAGDGTAKPQGDDIVRSKTVAKVTSNHVTCTYDDGSYCVPCVLMAC